MPSLQTLNAITIAVQKALDDGHSPAKVMWSVSQIVVSKIPQPGS